MLVEGCGKRQIRAQLLVAFQGNTGYGPTCDVAKAWLPWVWDGERDVLEPIAGLIDATNILPIQDEVV
jgi:hypothetical protein